MSDNNVNNIDNSINNENKSSNDDAKTIAVYSQPLPFLLHSLHYNLIFVVFTTYFINI